DNHAPLAVVGPDQTVNLGATVTLDGSGSNDPDPLDKLTYEWTLLAFPTNGEPQLVGGATSLATVTPSVGGPYQFRLRVSDGDLTSAPAYLSVVVIDPTKAKACGCGGPGGEAVAAAAAFAFFALAFGRRRG